MGALMRLFWTPFLLARDLAADGQPHRVRLLGEDLVAFRDSGGRVGLVDHACPHRGAPLVFARNEEGGLRCMYHGWKFDVDGACLETPAEPPDSSLCRHVRIKHYPVRERHGVLWAYLGPDAEAPPLPDLEWNLVPETQVALSARIQECNWLQALEGEIDSAHAAFLHGRVDEGSAIDRWRQAADLRPKFEVRAHEVGLNIASRRKVASGEQGAQPGKSVESAGREYIRVNQFLMPFYTLVPPQSVYPELSGHAWVPVDDEHTLCLMFSYTPASAFHERTRAVFASGGKGGRETGHPSDHAFEPKPVTHPYPMYWSKYNRGNAYRFDHSLQVDKFNSGVPGVWVQDAAYQSGVAAIYDRSRENLGTTDLGIARTRRFLLDALRRLENEGQRPAALADPALFMWRAISITVEAGADWKQAGAEFMRAKLGADFGYVP
jgi:phenylpropionate dioxygenase-like ring-hydroxylating dioxygenase large terminal subunit